MMRYRLQGQWRPDVDPSERFDEFEVEAEALPHVDEDVEVDGMLFRVIAVFHQARPVGPPIVRVK